MSLFRRNDNTEREHKGGNRPDGFLIGLLLGILLYFLFVSSQDPNFFRGFFSGNEQAFDQSEQSPADYKPEELCRVDHVVDGDTIVVVSEGAYIRVRLIGVDTPETVKPKTSPQPYGPEAQTIRRIGFPRSIIWSSSAVTAIRLTDTADAWRWSILVRMERNY